MRAEIINEELRTFFLYLCSLGCLKYEWQSHSVSMWECVVLHWPQEREQTKRHIVLWLIGSQDISSQLLQSLFTCDLGWNTRNKISISQVLKLLKSLLKVENISSQTKKSCRIVTFSLFVPTTTHISVISTCTMRSPHQSKWLNRDKQNEVVVLLYECINCTAIQFCEYWSLISHFVLVCSWRKYKPRLRTSYG